MRRVNGYGQWVDRESGKTVREFDTTMCRHCQAHIFVKPGTALTTYLLPNRDGLTFREEPGAWCRQCDGPVCLACHDIGVCTPFMRQIERAELETARRDALARAGRYTMFDPQ